MSAGTLVLTVAAAFGSTRLAFDTDVLSLLPRDGRVIPAFRTFLERFGSLDELYVVFTAPEGHSIEEYADAIDAWIVELRKAPEIARVDTGLVDRTRNLEWLADRQLLLMRGPALQTALDRLGGRGMRLALESRRELLALPSADIAELVRHDPLGLYDLVREGLGGAQAGVNLGVTEGGYLTPDSRSRMVIAHPVRPPYDTEFSHALLERLTTMSAHASTSSGAADAPDAPMTVEFAGGHRIAVETESIVRRESVLNTAGSLALILPLLFLVFRSVWLVAVGPLPSGIALVLVLGALGLAGATLSAAATASAAMLFGLGVDGVVLLYVAHTSALRGGLPTDAAADGLAGPATSMLIGMWTTAATFYGLTFVDFPSLQQLGALIGHSMVLCGVLTLLLVPALLPRRAARAPRAYAAPRLAHWVRRRRTGILAVAVAVTIVLGLAAVDIRINPTLDRLRSVTPGAVRLEAIVHEFGLPEDVYVLLQRGPELEPLLDTNERLARAIRDRLPSLPLQPATALLPSSATQAARSTAIAHAGVSVPGVTTALRAAAEAEGFRPDSFGPFLERLPRLIAAGQRVTYDGYRDHGLGDLIGRFVTRMDDEWLLVSYAFPAREQDVRALQRLVEDAGGATLTGLPLVNRELAERFVPQFAKGLAIGSLIVVVLIVAALRDWRLSVLSLTPAVLGLVWAAGLLALARVELDLFAVFAVVTFVGIGVDYGVHLVHRFQERGHATQATAELAPVILVAGAITLLGYGTLVTSSYPPLRSIGIVSVVTVVTLAAASIIVLPALLAGTPEPVTIDSSHT